MLGEPKQLLTRAGSGANEAANRVSRVPAGHPEGYLEGFANLYTDVAQAIIALRQGEDLPAHALYPTVNDGLVGIAFVTAAVESSRKGSSWVSVDV